MSWTHYLLNIYFAHSLELRFVRGSCVTVSWSPATRPPSQFAEHPERGLNEMRHHRKLWSYGKPFLVEQVCFGCRGMRMGVTSILWKTNKMQVIANTAPRIQSILLHICARGFVKVHFKILICSISFHSCEVKFCWNIESLVESSNPQMQIKNPCWRNTSDFPYH